VVRFEALVMDNAVLRKPEEWLSSLFAMAPFDTADNLKLGVVLTS